MNIYENLPATEEIMGEARNEWVVESISTENGLFLNIKGAEFPYKGMASLDAIAGMNIAKRLLIKGITVVSPLKLIFQSYRTKVIYAYSDIAYMATKPFVLKEEHRTSFTNELNRFTKNLLNNLNIREKTSDILAKTISHIFEYDSAYKFRIQDILSETTPERLYNAPIQEINRLLHISHQRDYEVVSTKFKAIGKILTFSLLIPSIRKAFKKAIKESNFENLQLDENDRYWTAQRIDYKFWGQSNEQRKAWLKWKGYKVPTYQQVIR